MLASSPSDNPQSRLQKHFRPATQTYTVLIVHSDAVLTSTVPPKCFQLISRRYLQVIERDGGIQNG
jgi:hypothetical protein